MTPSRDDKTSGRRRSRPRATQLDQEVGVRLRHARRLGGMSQDEVAKALGVSFQAIQKYENGDNRLSAGRLAAAAKALGVPITFFFQDNLQGTSDGTAAGSADFSGREIDLIRAFRAVRNQELRDHLLRLIDLIGLIARGAAD